MVPVKSCMHIEKLMELCTKHSVVYGFGLELVWDGIGLGLSPKDLTSLDNVAEAACDIVGMCWFGVSL